MTLNLVVLKEYVAFDRKRNGELDIEGKKMNEKHWGRIVNVVGPSTTLLMGPKESRSGGPSLRKHVCTQHEPLGPLFMCCVSVATSFFLINIYSKILKPCCVAWNVPDLSRCDMLPFVTDKCQIG